jgi:hypothetical protein
LNSWCSEGREILQRSDMAVTLAACKGGGARLSSI